MCRWWQSTQPLRQRSLVQSAFSTSETLIPSCLHITWRHIRITKLLLLQGREVTGHDLANTLVQAPELLLGTCVKDRHRGWAVETGCRLSPGEAEQSPQPGLHPQQMHSPEACKYTCRGFSLGFHKPTYPLRMASKLGQSGAQMWTTRRAKPPSAVLTYPRGSAHQPHWSPSIWKFLYYLGSAPSFSCLIPGITFQWLHYQVTFLS